MTKALTLVHFRSNEKQELANGWHMLAKRDAYVRIVLQRCCLLTSEWRWTMEGAEGALARLFDIFNSHKLADLPTEKEHDFPAFLRDFDVGKLSTSTVVDGDAMQDPASTSSSDFLAAPVKNCVHLPRMLRKATAASLVSSLE